MYIELVSLITIEESKSEYCKRCVDKWQEAFKQQHTCLLQVVTWLCSNITCNHPIFVAYMVQCNLRDVASEYSSNLRKLPGHFSYQTAMVWGWQLGLYLFSINIYMLILSSQQHISHLTPHLNRYHYSVLILKQPWAYAGNTLLLVCTQRHNSGWFFCCRLKGSRSTLSTAQTTPSELFTSDTLHITVSMRQIDASMLTLK